jgi:hypothetical protein
MLILMSEHANRILQPGWTGNSRAQRTVEAAQRTLSVGPIGHRSMAACLRQFGSPLWRSMSRFSSPVSVGLSLHRDGRRVLAQRQCLRALRRTPFDAKAGKTATAAAPASLQACASVRSALNDQLRVPRRHVECGKTWSVCPAVDRQPQGPAQATEPDRSSIRFFSKRTEDRSRTQLFSKRRGGGIRRSRREPSTGGAAT